MQNCPKNFKLAIKYANLYHFNALHNLHKLVFLVWKETIWQACVSSHALRLRLLLGPEDIGFPSDCSNATTANKKVEVGRAQARAQDFSLIRPQAQRFHLCSNAGARLN
jgi:hypothetical protein